MRILALMVMAMAMESAARAEEVTVYVQGRSLVSATEWNRAQALAGEIFAGVGVKVDWRLGQPPRSQSRAARAIVIEMVTGTPKGRTPGALAYALPYEGVHIDVYYDRVQQATEPEYAPNVLAHVLVHEITHILQGTSRHSDSGIMKAHWTHDDFMEMRVKPLSFTEEDVHLIKAGLTKSTDGRTLIAANPMR